MGNTDSSHSSTSTSIDPGYAGYADAVGIQAQSSQAQLDDLFVCDPLVGDCISVAVFQARYLINPPPSEVHPQCSVQCRLLAIEGGAGSRKKTTVPPPPVVAMDVEQPNNTAAEMMEEGTSGQQVLAVLTTVAEEINAIPLSLLSVINDNFTKLQRASAGFKCQPNPTNIQKNMNSFFPDVSSDQLLGEADMAHQLEVVLNEVLAAEFTPTFEILGKISDLIVLILEEYEPKYSELCELLSKPTLTSEQQKTVKTLYPQLVAIELKITMATGYVEQYRRGIVATLTPVRGLLQMIEEEQRRSQRSQSYVRAGLWLVVSLFLSALLAGLKFIANADDATYYTVFKLLEDHDIFKRYGLANLFINLFAPARHDIKKGAIPGVLPWLLREHKTDVWGETFGIMIRNGMVTGISWLVTNVVGVPVLATAFVVPLLAAIASSYIPKIQIQLVQLLVAHVIKPATTLTLGAVTENSVTQTAGHRRGIRQSAWMCKPETGRCMKREVRPNSTSRVWNEEKDCKTACLTANVKLKRKVAGRRNA